MNPEPPKSGYRRPSLPQPPVIDLSPPARTPGVGRAVFISALLGGVGWVGWTYRAPLQSAYQVVEKSYRLAFPDSSGKAKIGTASAAPKSPEVRPAAPPFQPEIPLDASERPKPVLAARSTAAAPIGLGKLELKTTGPAADPKWPVSVSSSGTPEVKVITEDSEAHKFVYQTANYEFQSDSPVGADAVREFSRVFEATFLANCRLPLNYRPAPEQGRERFVARLFATEQSYFAAGGMPGSAGVYSRDQAAMLAPVTTIGMKMVNGRMQTDRTEETDTLVHEITHQMMSAWLPRLPAWFIEGTADYMAMADYVHGRFMLNQMEDRLKVYLRRRQPDVKYPYLLAVPELMALTQRQWSQGVSKKSYIAQQNYSSGTLLVYYFYHLEGRGDAAVVKAFLKAIEDGMPQLVATEKYLLHGRSPEELQADVINAYAERHIKISLTSRGGKHWEPAPPPKAVVPPRVAKS